DFELMGDILRRRSRDPHLQLSNPSWVGAVSLTQQSSSAFVKGRGILAGDAAHVFSTTPGHGLHAAIEDALNLEWKLGLPLSSAAAPWLLRSYEIERHRHAEDVVRLTRHGLNFHDGGPAGQGGLEPRVLRGTGCPCDLNDCQE